MMNLKRALLAAALCVALLLTGCVEKVEDVSKYITLGQYKGVEVAVGSSEVTQADIDAQVKSALAEYVTRNEITGRPLADGDIANIDFTGYIDGTAFDGGTGAGYELTIGSGSFIGDFEQQLIGMNTGETKDVSVAFPEDYYVSDLAGKPAVFTVKLNSIGQDIYPEVTDAFVKENLGFDNAQAFLDSANETAVNTKISNIQAQKEEDVWSAVVENAQVIKLPSDKVDAVTTSMNDMYNYYAQYYSMTLENFVSSQLGMTFDQYNEQIKTYAESSVKEELVVKAIAKAESLTVSQEDKDMLISYYMNQYSVTSKDDLFKNYIAEEDIETTLLYDKVLDLVVENSVEKPA